MTNQAPRIVVLVSGAGSIMKALAEAAQSPQWGGTIAAVIADRQAPALDFAASKGIPTATVKPADFPDRPTWDAALLKTVSAFQPHLVVLAGFMRLIGAPLLDAYGGRIVNTHPALLPAFPGAHGVRDALAAGVKVTGCTVMLVDEGVDTGPILAQAPVDVREDDTEESLHERIKSVERDVVVRTIGIMMREGWSVQGRITRLGTNA